MNKIKIITAALACSLGLIGCAASQIDLKDATDIVSLGYINREKISNIGDPYLVTENGKYYVDLINEVSREHINSVRRIEILISNNDENISSHFSIEYFAEKSDEDGYILGYDSNEKGYLIGVQPKTPINDFKRILTSVDDIQVLINEKEVVQEYAYSGMKITLLDNKGEVLLDENDNPITYTVIVK